LLLIAVTGVDLWALRPAEGQRQFWGVLAIGLTLVVVIAPAVLDRGSRWAFARGHFTWAVRLAAARVTLMPGAGLEPSLEVVRALEIVERRGLDPALTYLTELARETSEDRGVDPSLIHEQVVTLLLHGQRWQEGTEYYERHFHPGYAVFRPGLALGLLRAYGERGRLDAAAGLLRAFESSHARGEARSVELVAQAWLTFAAYAGDSKVVDELDETGVLERIGVSPATGAFLRGVAWTQAGDAGRARAALRRVEGLARPTDHGVLAESRVALAALEGDGDAACVSGSVDLSPELSRYAEIVSARLRAAANLRAGAVTTSALRPWVSVAAGIVLVGLYGLGVARTAQGADWLELGATSTSLWNAGAWWRVATAPWVHMDLLSLSVSLCGLWIAGRGLEVSRGWGRTALLLFLCPTLGLAAAHLLDVYPMHLGAAGCLVATSVVAGGFAPLVLDRHRDRRRRRHLLIAHAMLLVVTGVGAIPTPIGLDVSPIAWAATGCLAFAIAAAPAFERGPWRALQRVGAGLGLAATVAAFAAVAYDDEDALGASGRQRCVQHEVAFVVGPGWIPSPPLAESLGGLFGVPVLEGGMLDGVALRSGNLWQVVVLSEPGDASRSILISLDPTLEDVVALRSMPWPEGVTLPEGAAAPAAWLLRKNGEVVGQSFEFSLQDRRVAVVRAPATEQLQAEAAPRLGAIWRRAQRVELAPDDSRPGTTCNIDGA